MDMQRSMESSRGALNPGEKMYRTLRNAEAADRQRSLGAASALLDGFVRQRAAPAFSTIDELWL